MARPKKTTKSTISTVSSVDGTVAKACETRSKADVSTAFSTLRRDVSQQESIDPKYSELLKSRRDSVDKAVAGMSVEKAVQNIASLNLEVTRSLSALQETLTNSLGELDTVNAAIDMKKEELSRLYELDVAATSIANLVEEYNKREQEFNKSIFDARNIWAKEQADHTKFVSDRNAETEKARQREQADYEYRVRRDRQLAQDNFDEAMRKQDRDNQNKQEILNKSWAEREDSLKSREKDYSEMSAKVADFPNVLKAEVAKAEAILNNRLNSQHKVETQMLQKDSEAAKYLYETRIKALEETINKQNSVIDQLQRQIDASKQQTQDVVLKALESASGRSTLQEITNFMANKESSSSKSASK